MYSPENRANFNTTIVNSSLKRFRVRYAIFENCSVEYDVWCNSKGDCIWHEGTIITTYSYINSWIGDESLQLTIIKLHRRISNWTLKTVRDMTATDPRILERTARNSQKGLFGIVVTVKVQRRGCKTGRHVEKGQSVKRLRYSEFTGG